MTVPGVRVRVRGYDYYQDGGGSGSPVVFTPTRISLTDPTAFAYIQTATHTVYPDPVTGYFYADLIATNDPNLTPFLWRVTFDGRSFLIEVDYLAAVVDVGGGLQRAALWLTEAASPDNVPPNPTAYYTSTQTDSRIGTAVGVHNVAGDSHGDLRALIAGITSPVTSVAGRTGAVVLAETDVANLVTDLSGKAPTSHSHAESDVAGLVSDLSGKSAVGHTHSYAPVSHAHVESDVTNLTSDLSTLTSAVAGKAPTSHTHAESDVTSLVSDLAGKAADSAVVHNTGVETVAGVKTFSSSPIVPTPTTGTQAANKSYADSIGSTVTVPADKTTNYTLVLGDANSSIGYNSASAGTFTIPPNSSVAFPVGSVVEARQVGAGRVAFAAGAGVTMRAADGYVTTRVQYSAMCALKVATDTWNISGDVAV